MVTPWKYEKEKDKTKKTDPRLLELMKELVKIAKNNLEGESFDEIFGKRSVYLEFRDKKRHRLFEFMDLSLAKNEEIKTKFLVRGLFVGLMEIGEDGMPLDVCYSIRIPNSEHLVMEETMFENRALSLGSFEEVLADIKNSQRINKEDYAKYVEKAIEEIANRRKKE